MFHTGTRVLRQRAGLARRIAGVAVAPTTVPAPAVLCVGATELGASLPDSDAALDKKRRPQSCHQVEKRSWKLETLAYVKTVLAVSANQIQGDMQHDILHQHRLPHRIPYPADKAGSQPRCRQACWSGRRGAEDDQLLAIRDAVEKLLPKIFSDLPRAKENFVDRLALAIIRLRILAHGIAHHFVGMQSLQRCTGDVAMVSLALQGVVTPAPLSIGARRVDPPAFPCVNSKVLADHCDALLGVGRHTRVKPCSRISAWNCLLERPFVIVVEELEVHRRATRDELRGEVLQAGSQLFCNVGSNRRDTPVHEHGYVLFAQQAIGTVHIFTAAAEPLLHDLGQGFGTVSIMRRRKLPRLAQTDVRCVRRCGFDIPKKHVDT